WGWRWVRDCNCNCNCNCNPGRCPGLSNLAPLGRMPMGSSVMGSVMGSIVMPNGSIPHISLVPFDAMTAEELAKLVLECHLAMMLFLIRDVPFDDRHVRLADGERAVPALPIEVLQVGRLILDPCRR